MRSLYLIIAIAIGLMALGCSGSGSVDPVMPDPNSAGTPEITGQIDVPSPTNRYLWGFWNIHIDENGVGEVVYERGAQNHFNVVRLLEIAPCTSCLTLSNFIFLPNDEIRVDLSLKHPFASHKKFTGFDVRGIMVTNSDYTFPESGRTVAFGVDMPTMLNADGYTSLFNPTEYPEDTAPFPMLGYIQGKYTTWENLTATLNPYLAYEYDAPRRIFNAGQGSTRTVQIHSIHKPFEFGYAVDASWLPIEEPVIDPLTQFPPEANAMEAYSVMVMVDKADLTTSPGTTAGVTAIIQDHQGLETITGVSVETPDLYDGTVDLAYDHSDVTGHVYTGTIVNEKAADLGSHPLLVRVTDSDTDGNLGVVDAWQVFDLDITNMGTSPPVAIAIADTYTQYVGGEIEFSDDGSYDPDGGAILVYEWDWDNDGTFDEVGATLNHSWDTEGVYLVQFRVTDDESEMDTLDDPLEINIEGQVGHITGIVRNGLDYEPLANATAETLDGGYQADTTEIDGIYELFNLPPGQVTIDFSCPGFIPASANFEIIGGETTVGDVVLLAPENPETGNLTGNVTDATNGTDLNLVTLDLREGINNLTGPIIDTTITNTNGLYNFMDHQAGSYTIAAYKDGYHDVDINVAVIGGQTTTNDLTMSPVLGEGEIRIVLTWAEDPRDLDSHLLTPEIEGQKYHIAFYELGDKYNPPYADLDWDDVTSFGPETVTIMQLFPGRYKYFVHHWAGDGQITTTSDAHVVVYDWSGMIAEFNAPQTGEYGLWWDVFNMDGTTGDIDIINEIVQSEPTWP